jgi:hypothetical protein
LIEHFERRFEQRRPGALKDERSLLRERRGDRSLIRSTRKWQLDNRLGKGWRRRDCQGGGTGCL